MIGYLYNLFLLSTTLARMFITARWVSRQKDGKQLSKDIWQLRVGGKYSISYKTTFSPNLHLVKEATCFRILTLWHSNWTDTYPYPWTTYYIPYPIKSACIGIILVAYHSDFFCRELCIRWWILAVERDGNLSFNLLITGYGFVRCQKDGDFEEYIQTYYEVLNQTLLVQKYWRLSPIIFYRLWHQLSKKASVCFRSITLRVANNHVN